jgi:hypothetical protein
MSGPGSRVLSWQAQTSLASITDGTSNTVLLGEKYVDPTYAYSDGSIYCSSNFTNYKRLLGFGMPLVSAPQVSLTSYPQPNWLFGGPHPGVVLFLFCDGTVHPIKRTTSDQVLGRLARRADGEVISGW